ncbi:MAG: rhodanese-like domain-containing protein, partial [Myxococcota bacterium]|nr:rhodanese-like domain-containing protein [Myxococcota bacterium]
MVPHGARRPLGAPPPVPLAVFIALVTLLVAPAALALPPQGVAALAWGFLWVFLVVANGLVLAARFLPTWLRFVLALGLLSGGLHAAFVLGQESEQEALRAVRVDPLPSAQALPPPELSPSVVPDEVLTARQALDLAAVDTVAWIDLRRTANHATGHIEGAHHVPLLEAQSFELVGDLGWILDPTRRPTRVPGAMPALESVQRAETLARAMSPPPARVIVYCNGGLTSAYVAHALRARGISASRVPGGFYALARLGASVVSSPSEAPSRPLSKEETAALSSRLTLVDRTPTRETNIAWSTLATPPSDAPPPNDTTVVLLRYGDFSASLTARWAGALWRAWGYPHVVLVDEREHTAGEAAGLSTLLAIDDTLGRAWWLVAWALSLLAALVSTWYVIRRHLATGPTGALTGIATAAQAACVVAVEHVASTASAHPWLGFSEIPSSVHFASLFVLAIAVSLRARESALARTYRLLSGVRHARDGVRVGPGAPPWELAHLALGALVALAAHHLVATPTVLVTATALAAGPVLWHLRSARLRRRLVQAAGDDVALEILLRASGVATTFDGVDGELSSASDRIGWGVWRPPAAPAQRWSLFVDDPLEVPEVVARAVARARQVTRVAARAVTLEEGRWRVAQQAQPEHQQVITAGSAALDRGTAWSRLGDARLSRERLAEAVDRPSELALDMLRYRGSEHGAAGRAARRFGARLRPDPLVQIGGRAYEVLPPSSAPTAPGRPGGLSRLVSAATLVSAPRIWRSRIVPDALARLGALGATPTPATLRRALRALWDQAAVWPELVARAALVAEQEVQWRAAQEGLAAFPPPPMTTGMATSASGPYELHPGRGRGGLTSQIAPLLSAESLAHGPGSQALRRWRGRARAAGRAREAARRLMLAQLAALGDGLAASGEAVFGCSVDAVARSLRGQALPASSEPVEVVSGWPDEVAFRDLG